MKRSLRPVSRLRTGLFERIFGRVGEELLVQKQERKEVTVSYDVERLARIVAELKQLGAIEGEAEPVD